MSLGALASRVKAGVLDSERMNDFGTSRVKRKVKRVNATVIGSGFAGSILAWILTSRGKSVALVDQVRHPRFAVGESSTPIADSILRQLGDRYDLPELRELSCWGSWQRAYPDLPCGRKRGFSYFVHESGESFSENRLGEKSLLVAASPTDDRADTHWHRASIDTFLWKKAVAAGAVDLTGHRVVNLEHGGLSKPRVICKECLDKASASSNEEIEIESEWVFDASGSSGVFSKFLKVEDQTRRLRTNTHARFAHFEGIKPWGDVVGPGVRQDFELPFSADDAAQHHLFSQGWMWMLRFQHGVTSVGYTAPTSSPLLSFEDLAEKYPTIGSLFSESRLVAPSGGPVVTQRLQRWFAPHPQPRCVMLPTSALTLDPLHSTGIAHALAGVERLAGIVLSKDNPEQLLAKYSQVLTDETLLIDRLVQMAYRNLSRFELFATACMLYFAGAIRCEEAYQAGESPSHLWNAGDEAFGQFVSWVDSRLDTADSSLLSEIRHRLEPWNTAGLMDAAVRNRYAYTATK